MVKLEAISYVFEVRARGVVRSDDVSPEMLGAVQDRFDELMESPHLNRDRNDVLVTAVANTLEISEKEITLITTEDKEPYESDTDENRVH